MCIAFWGKCEWGFFLAFNRDEYILRPAQPAHFWQDNPHILAGRDLSANGTWLGLSVKSGRVAFVTNLRAKDPPPDEAQRDHSASRGQLVTDFLNSKLSPEAYIKSLDVSRYHGFNLVCVDLATNTQAYTHNLSTLHGSQAQDDVQKSSCGAAPGGQCLPTVVPLEAGKLYGLSNGLLNEWPKVQSGISVATKLLHSYEEYALRDPQGARQSLPWDALFGDLLGDPRRDESLLPKSLQPAQEQNQQQQQQQQQQQGSSGASAYAAGPPAALGAVSTQAAPAWPLVAEGVQGSCSRIAESLAPSSRGRGTCAEQLNADELYEFVASARFISPVPSRFGPYGTRSQTVLAVWEDGTGELRERYLELQEGGKHVWHEEKHTFALEVS